MQFKELSDRALSNLIYEGEQMSEKAFTEIYTRWGSKVYRRAINIVYTRENAEEITQDVFLSYYTKVCLDGSRKIDKVGHYLLRTTSNKCFNFREKQVVRGRYFKDLKYHYSQKYEKKDQVGLIITVHEIIRELPKRLRLLVIQKYFEGMSSKEIAEEEGRPLRTVNFHLWRMKKHLLRKIEAAGISAADLWI